MVAIEHLPQRRFTVEEYDAMIAAGVLHEDERVELIEGRIVQMAPIGIKHAVCTDETARALIERLGRRVYVRIQGPLLLAPGSEPEPDIIVARPGAERYRSAHITPQDVLLVIEVADTTLRYDREVKGRLYAEAGIADYWVLDLKGSRLLVLREPREGRYRQTTILRPGGSVSPLAFPELTLSVSDLLL
ncbi:MAG TPA: Uma2 family endonuclease [Dehalococcoidia bacterium]|jgi:Uma2 family endonuclease|nr:Uma2 family endonuclease [Dehalococcoidia bacterium]